MHLFVCVTLKDRVTWSDFNKHVCSDSTNDLFDFIWHGLYFLELVYIY